MILINYSAVYKGISVIFRYCISNNFIMCVCVCVCVESKHLWPTKHKWSHISLTWLQAQGKKIIHKLKACHGGENIDYVHSQDRLNL
jgi:hypothetical protein